MLRWDFRYHLGSDETAANVANMWTVKSENTSFQAIQAEGMIVTLESESVSHVKKNFFFARPGAEVKLMRQK